MQYLMGKNYRSVNYRYIQLWTTCTSCICAFVCLLKPLAISSCSISSCYTKPICLKIIFLNEVAQLHFSFSIVWIFFDVQKGNTRYMYAPNK